MNKAKTQNKYNKAKKPVKKYRVKEQVKEQQLHAEKIKEYTPPKKYELTKYTERHNSVEPLTNSTDVMIVQSSLEPQCFQQIFQVVASYLYSFGALANRTQGTDLLSEGSFQGVAWMVDALIRYAQGQQELGKTPHIIAIYANLLRQKEIKFRFGKLSYSPNIATQTYSTVMVLMNGDIWFNSPPQVDDSTFLSLPAVNIVPDSMQYSNILTCFSRKEAPLSSIVDIEKVAYKYKKDPSCFARSYPYFGSSGVPGVGLYTDAELEVWFKFPSFSKFVRYGDNDTVVSRVFKPQTGPPTLNLAFALTDTQFHEKHLLNTIPVVYKFLDLTEFYCYVTAWMARAMATFTIPPGGGFTLGTLPFSKSDFLVILRQAVLTQFLASQLQGQFTQPLLQANATANSFKPLVLDPYTTPTPAYAGMILPSVLVENLSMLRQGSYCTKEQTRNSKDIGLSPYRITYVPVWGAYVEDDLPDIDIPIDVPFPLFQATNVLPPYNSITDLRTNSVNQKMNPNGQNALNVLAQWNQAAQSINALTQVAAISTDTNFAGNLLIYSRIQQAQANDLRKQNVPTIQDPSSRFLKPTVSKKDAKGKVMVSTIAAANLYTQAILSIKPVPSQMTGNLFKLFIPSVRLDITDEEDQLTQTAYQTYTGEVCTSPYTWSEVTNGNNLLSRVYTFAGDMINTQFSPTSDQDTLSQAFQMIGKESWGASLFGDLAAGLLGNIPIIGGVAANLAKQFL